MAIYTVEIPGSGTFDVESDTDLTDAQAYQYALLQSDKIKAHEAKTGIGAATKAGFQRALGSADVGIAGALRGLGFNEQAADFAKSAEKRQAKAQETYEPTTEEDVAEAEARGVLPGGIASFRKNISEPLGQFAGRYGPTTAAVTLGGLPGAVIAGGAEYLTGAGEIQERGGSPEAAYTMAAPVAALNVVGLPLGPLSKGATSAVSKALGRATPEIAEQSVLGAAKQAQEAATKEGLNVLGQLEGKAAAEAETTPFRAASKAATEEANRLATDRTKSQLAGDIATSTLGNVAVGTPTALAQEAMIRAASGEEQQTPEEMVDTAKQMALLSPFFGAMHGTLHNPNLEVQHSARAAEEKVRTAPEALAAEKKLKEAIDAEIPPPTKRGATPTAEEATTELSPEEIITKPQDITHPYDVAAKEAGVSHLPYKDLTSFAQKQADALAQAESETVGPKGVFPQDKVSFIQDINDQAVKTAYDSAKSADQPAYADLSPQAKVMASRLAGADIHGGKDVIPTDVMQHIVDVHKLETEAPKAPKLDTPYHSMTLDEYQANHPNPYKAYAKILKTDIAKMSDEDVLSQFDRDDLREMAQVLGTKISGPSKQILGNIRTVMSNRDMMKDMSRETLDGMKKFELVDLAKKLGAPSNGSVASLRDNIAAWRENNIKATQNRVATKNLSAEIAKGVRDGENVKIKYGAVPIRNLFEHYLTENTHPETYDAVINSRASDIVMGQNKAGHLKDIADNILSAENPFEVQKWKDLEAAVRQKSANQEAMWESQAKKIAEIKARKAAEAAGEPVKPTVDEAFKAKEEAVVKQAAEPTPENTAEALKATVMHDAAEREAARPVVEDTTPPLKAEEPKVNETPTNAEATLLADRYSTTRERENLSTMDKVRNFTKSVVQRHADKWAPALEKVGKKYGMYTDEGVLNAGYLGHQFDQAANMMEQAAMKGGLRLREDGQVEIRQEPIKLHTGETANASIVNMHKLINSLGPNGKDIANEILRIKDEARQLKLDPSKVSKKVSQNPQAFQEKVKAADQFIKENPVMQDVINMYRKVHEMQIDFHEQTGTIDKKLADFFRSQEDYSPRYEMREEVLDKLGADKVNRTPIGGMFTKTFKERTGADHEVNPLENIANQFTGDYMKSWYNHVKSNMADQFTKVGAAEYIGRTKNPQNQGNVAVLKNGKREFYNFANPEDLPAMQIAANSLGPLAFATKFSHALRFGALSTPGFWWKELARNPLAATLTSDLGWLTPAHSMYEVTKMLKGDNEVFHKLQNAGIVGSVDPVFDPRESRSFARNLGTKVQESSATKKTIGMALHKIENIHTVFDAATKCAVYRMAYDKGIREGMSPRKADGYAITKARESFNHNVSGSAEMQRNARLLIPFLGSGINALELLRKNIMMPHIKESERAAYRKQFVNKAATVAMLSGAYAFMMAGDPEYEKQKSSFKYSNILVPTGMEDHPYIGVALPPDLAFLHWLPNMMVQYTLGTREGSELWDDMKDQLKTMVPGGLAYTAGIPIPQAVKPALEAVMGKSSYTGQDIISKADQSKLPEERGEFTSTLTAKTLGKATGISPPIIDHLATGYLAEVGKLGMWAADAILSTLGVGEGITKPEKNWAQTPGLGLQSVFGQHLGSQHVDDFYTHKEEADQLRKTFNDIQKAGSSRRDDMQEFVGDKERMAKKNAATQMDAFAKQMTVLENQNRMIMRSKLPEEEITKRVEANKERRNELAKRANEYWKKQINR